MNFSAIHQKKCVRDRNDATKGAVLVCFFADKYQSERGVMYSPTMSETFSVEITVTPKESLYYFSGTIP